MKPRIGINGFGRIGRALTRIALKTGAFDIVVINDINPDLNNWAYLLKYDSTYGKLEMPVIADGTSLKIGDTCVKTYMEKDINGVPWGLLGVDIVIDATGVFRKDYDDIDVDAVILTHANNGKDAKTIIFGVNEHTISDDDHLFSSSICDTIALAPLLQFVEDNYGIKNGFLTTLHPWLSYQNLLDGQSKSWSMPGDVFSHYALGRSSAMNIIPKSTSAVAAVDLVLPQMTEKVHSFSYRVPTQIVSSAVLTLNTENCAKDLPNGLKMIESVQAHKILKISEEPLTSLDYVGNEHSLILDNRWSYISPDGRSLKLVYWYDNEWGYSSRVADLVEAIWNKKRS